MMIENKKGLRMLIKEIADEAGKMQSASAVSIKLTPRKDNISGDPLTQ